MEKRKGLYNLLSLKVGGTYTRQKMRIAMGKIYPTHKILEYMDALEQKQYTKIANKSPMCENLDTITILKDFTNGKEG